MTKADSQCGKAEISPLEAILIFVPECVVEPLSICWGIERDAREAPLSRKSAVECNIVIIRKAEADAQLLAA